MQQVHDEIKQACASARDLEVSPYTPAEFPKEQGVQRIGIWPLYRTDNIVRRSEPLQQTLESTEFGVRLNEATAKKLQVTAGEQVSVCQDDICVALPVIIDSRGANDCVYIAAGVCGSEDLGSVSGPVVIKKKAE